MNLVKKLLTIKLVIYLIAFRLNQ